MFGNSLRRTLNANGVLMRKGIELIKSTSEVNNELNNFYCFPMSIPIQRKFGSKLVRIPVQVYEHGEYKSGNKKRKNVNSSGQSSSENELETDTSGKDAFEKAMSELVKIKGKGRRKIAVDGTRLIEEALLCGLKMEALFLTKDLKEIPKRIERLLKKQEEVKIHRVPQRSMQIWSTLTTPPGIIGIFPKPSTEELEDRGSHCKTGKPLPLTLICDNTREPGNLGGMLRSAAGVGCNQILLSQGCVDCWDIKVLRGGSGAHFHIPIITNIPHEMIGNYVSLEEKESSRTGIFLADSNEDEFKNNLPLIEYTQPNFANFDHIFLIMGNEVEGLSKETLKIAESFMIPSRKNNVEIARLKIPLRNKMESLNVSHAFSIIAFEILRQISPLLKMKENEEMKQSGNAEEN